MVFIVYLITKIIQALFPFPSTKAKSILLQEQLNKTFRFKSRFIGMKNKKYLHCVDAGNVLLLKMFQKFQFVMRDYSFIMLIKLF